MSKIKSDFLEKDGPVIGILVLPPDHIQDQIKNSGQRITGIHIRAIIDTGAESSSISIKTLEELNLVPHNMRPRISAHGKNQQPVFDVVVQIQFNQPKKDVNFKLEAAGLDLDEFGIYALIGRDILKHCKLIYNGKVGNYELEFLG